MLPHIIGYGKESVASSVKWARRKMEKHNIDYLTNESEEEIEENANSVDFIETVDAAEESQESSQPDFMKE